jgi:hypothetical protein
MLVNIIFNPVIREVATTFFGKFNQYQRQLSFGLSFSWVGCIEYSMYMINDILFYIVGIAFMILPTYIVVTYQRELRIQKCLNV